METRYPVQIKLIFNQVKELIKEIQTINTTLNTEFSKNYMNIPYDVLLNNCLRLQLLLLSVVNYLPLLNTELEAILPQISKLDNFIKNVLPPIAVNSRIREFELAGNGRFFNTENYFTEFAFAIDEIRGEFDITKSKQHINDMYSSISNNSSIINNVINLINELCGYKYINLYFNNFNNPFANPNTELINNIYFNKLNILNTIPSKIDDILCFNVSIVDADL